MNMVESLKDRANGVMTSAGDLNRIVVDKLERGAQLNLASASYYSEVGIKHLRSMSGVRDLESMQKFTADSISQGGELIKKMLDDSKAWMSLLGEAKDQLGGVFKSSVGEAGEVKKKASVKSAAA